MLKRPVTVADTQVQCDPNCHESSGCSERGEGKCDSECVDGYSVNRETSMCMSKYTFNLSCVSISQQTSVASCTHTVSSYSVDDSLSFTDDSFVKRHV